jgi:hypothetical protein
MGDKIMDDLKQGDKIKFEITAEVDHFVVSGTMKNPEIIVWVKLKSLEYGIPLGRIQKVDP